MTKDEFIADYCERSRIPWEKLQQYKTCLPCECGESCCTGWAMIPNEEGAIRTHLFFHGPDEGRPSAP
jgi:hypothetical protein